MSECAETCPYITGVYGQLAERQKLISDALRHADGLSKLINLDEDARAATIETFGNPYDAAMFLGDEKTRLEDVIDVLPEEAKSGYRTIHGILLSNTTDAMELCEEAMSSCDRGKPLVAKVGGGSIKAICQSDVVHQYLLESDD